jgi:hypothetical protein
MVAWVCRRAVRLDSKWPGQPVENGCIGSFGGRLRDE